jgi:hypothetical protein
MMGTLRYATNTFGRYYVPILLKLSAQPEPVLLHQIN